MVSFYILCNNITCFLLSHCKANLPLSSGLCCMFLYSCLPTVTPFPGVIVKVFGHTNPMWVWERLKGCKFDLTINITNLTFQFWASNEIIRRSSPPTSHSLHPHYYSFDLIFTVSKSHNPESLVIKAQVRHQTYSPSQH